MWTTALGCTCGGWKCLAFLSRNSLSTNVCFLSVLARSSFGKRCVGSPRKTVLGCDADHGLRESAEERSLGQGISESRRASGEARPPVDEAHSVGAHGTKLAFVIVRKKLGLVGRHINIHGAVSLAALTGQA